MTQGPEVAKVVDEDLVADVHPVMPGTATHGFTPAMKAPRIKGLTLPRWDFMLGNTHKYFGDKLL